MLYLELPDLHTRVRLWQSNFAEMHKAQWQLIDLSLRRIKHPFQLVFLATNFNLFAKKYHAIDDIQLRNCGPSTPSLSGNCPYAFACRNRVCIAKSSVCDFEDDCGDGSDEVGCDQAKMTDFEQGYGRWGESGVKTGWTIKKPFGSLRFGPTYDHTSGKNKRDPKPRVIMSRLIDGQFPGLLS